MRRTPQAIGRAGRSLAGRRPAASRARGRRSLGGGAPRVARLVLSQPAATKAERSAETPLNVGRRPLCYPGRAALVSHPLKYSASPAELVAEFEAEEARRRAAQACSRDSR
jgi:hypothetical protein